MTGYDVGQVVVEARPTVVAVGEIADLSELGGAILGLSRLAYAALDEAGVDARHHGCNVALYRPGPGDDGAGGGGGGGRVLVVEVGVELRDVPAAGPAALFDPPSGGGGPVRLSALPGGPVATTLHRGPYHELPAAHAAVRAWSASVGLELAGPNWEVYGDWKDDPDQLETEVFYLLAS